MEISKISTLRLMMDQEKKNLENLRSSSNNSNRNSNDILRAEANITKLGEQLRQMCGEVSKTGFPQFSSSIKNSTKKYEIIITDQMETTTHNQIIYYNFILYAKKKRKQNKYSFNG